MKHDYFGQIRDLAAREGWELTQGQMDALDVFFDFFTGDASRPVMMLRGAAGTGKTFMIRLMQRMLTTAGWQSCLLAPTGRAAKVISRRTHRYAATLHRHIYTALETPGAGISFSLKENRDPDRLIYFVDEASMIGDGSDDAPGGGLLSEFFRYVWQFSDKRKVVLVGDPAQLPPVGASRSPALDGDWLREHYRTTLFAAELDEVLRQDEASDVLRCATVVRRAMTAGRKPVMQPDRSGDVQVLDQGYEALELYTGLYDHDDPDKVLFVTYSNNLAVQVNAAIRRQLLDAEEPLVQGDRIMVVRNNYAWASKQVPFLANGEMGTVTRVYRDSLEKKYGLTFIDADIEFQDVGERPVEMNVKLVLDLLSAKAPQLDYSQTHRVFLERRNDPEALASVKRKDGLRKDPYVHALQIKYGYAVTGHKAQGGQWEHVIVGFEPMYAGMNLPDYLRWTYTAMTRAESRLYLLGCPFLPQD